MFVLISCSLVVAFQYFLCFVLFDLIFGVLGLAVIRGLALIRINEVYLGEVSPALFLKILLHVKLEPVVTLQFHSFQFHGFF